MVSKFFVSASADITTWIFVALLVVLVVVLLVVPMFTNKKRAKQTMDLHNSLMPGDTIKTVGGIIGVIKEIKQVSPTEREMIIETGDGDNKTTMVFDIQALYQVLERAPRKNSSSQSEIFEGHSDVEHKDEQIVDEAGTVEESADSVTAVAQQPEADSKDEVAETDAAVKEEDSADAVVSETEETAAAADVAVADAEKQEAEQTVPENHDNNDVAPKSNSAPKSVKKPASSGTKSTAKKKPAGAKNSTKK